MTDDRSLPTQLAETVRAPLGGAEWELEAEAMRRRLGARLFGEPDEPIYLGRFRVIEVLGSGGMGVIYAARDEKLGRLVALKIIRYPNGRSDGEEQRRMLREARALARLSHPNVVHIYEVGEVGDEMFIAMEHVPGMTLQRWLVREARPLGLILEKFIEAGRGLSAAHRAGIVHRDFKPSNVLVGDDGRVRLIDFGLARGGVGRAIEAAAGSTSSSAVSDGSTTAASLLSVSGSIAGTPAYMPPEAFSAGGVDARGDQFSFTVALYEAVHGHRPVRPQLPLASGSGASVAFPEPRGERRIPRWLSQVLARGLALEPANRYPTMDALLDALSRLPARRRLLAAGAGFVLAVGGAVIGLTQGVNAVDPCEDLGEPLQGVWDAATRDGVHDAIVRTKLSYAESAWTRMDSQLDEYTRRWIEKRRDSCEATWVRHEQSSELLDRSMLCLHDGRRAIASLVGLVQEGDPAVISAIDVLASSLPDPAICRDARFLLEGTASPGDARAAAVQAEIYRGELLQKARKGHEFLPRLDEMLAQADTLRDPALVAPALLLRARILRGELYDFDAAAELLHRAYDAAVAGDNRTLVWSIWNELALVDVNGRERPDSARIWLTHARAALGRSPQADPGAEAALLTTESNILYFEGHLADAERRRREVLELRTKHLPATHPDITWARMGVAQAIADLGQLDEALRQLRELAAEQARSWGPEHPGTAAIEHEAAVILLQLERRKEARELLERERPIVVATFGPDSADVADVDLLLAEIDLAEQKLPAAIARAASAREVFSRRFPKTYVQHLRSLVVLAEGYRLENRLADGLEVYRELLAIADATPDELGVDVPGLLFNIGEVQCLIARCAEALPYFSRLLALTAQDPSAPPGTRARALLGAGRVLVTNNQAAVALPFLEEALQIIRADPESAPELLDTNLRLLARALSELRIQPARARELVREANALRLPARVMVHDR